MLDRNWEKDWEMCQRATRGTWGYYPSYCGVFANPVCKDNFLFSSVPDLAHRSKDTDEDFWFISQARDALPYWLQRVRELELDKIDEKTLYELRLESQRQLIDNLIEQRDEWSDEAIFMRQRVRELEELLKDALHEIANMCLDDYNGCPPDDCKYSPCSRNELIKKINKVLFEDGANHVEL